MTYADSPLRVLGRSRNRPRTVTPHPIPAAELKTGQQIRDRGQLHTIDEIQRDDQFGSVAVIMEDGGRLGGIPLTERVTVWLPEEAAHA